MNPPPNPSLANDGVSVARARFPFQVAPAFFEEAMKFL
jgi:hypothetical protein